VEALNSFYHATAEDIPLEENSHLNTTGVSFGWVFVSVVLIVVVAFLSYLD
jgi:hypothetical protein